LWVARHTDPRETPAGSRREAGDPAALDRAAGERPDDGDATVERAGEVVRAQASVPGRTPSGA
jgi:hypothetical protein